MMTLDEIAIKHGTDKASKHPLIAGHDYCRFYEQFFEPLRDQPIKFLEIGVGGGESIRAWLEYFPNAKIFGLDFVQHTNPWNTPRSGVHERYTFVHGDQTDEVMWKCLAADYGGDWDVVMDDGGHHNDQVIISFNALWPALKSRGLYCVEDLGCAYGGPVFVHDGYPNQLDFLKAKVEDANKGQGIESIHFFKELAIIRKA